MREALSQIKQDLGDDAMILKTRKIPRKMFTIGSQDEIEVTAAIEDSAVKPSAPMTPLSIKDPGVYGRSMNLQKPVTSKPSVEVPPAPLPKATGAAPAQQTPMDRLRIMEMREDIREIKDLMKSILQPGDAATAGGYAGPWAVLYKRMIDADVQPAVMEELIRTMKADKSVPDADIEKKFIRVLGEQFPVAGPIQEKPGGPCIVAFVGPTGAGKTTTLAKLAAHYSLNLKSSVSLITADTYRIAAIEQIRTFADIVNIELQVVFSPEEIPDAVASCSHNRFIFVDTAGRSQRSSEHLLELEKYMIALRPDEIHLVLSASTKESDLLHVIQQYKKMGVNRLLFTKLDETLRLGNVFNTVRTSGIPVAYLTTGQNVPEDIELAQPGRFIQKLWEGSSL
jgi:flagellar biosynthesis protein FlhF